MESRQRDNRVVISDEDIMQVISKWTGIPLQRMDEIKKPQHGKNAGGNDHWPGATPSRLC